MGLDISLFNWFTHLPAGQRAAAQAVAPARISPMAAADWPAVRAIYEEGMATGNSTFETGSPEWAAWDAAHRLDCRLVARQNGRVIGWLCRAGNSWPTNDHGSQHRKLRNPTHRATSYTAQPYCSSRSRSGE